MILRLDGYDDLYLNKLRKQIGRYIVEIPCPSLGYCDSECGIRQLCAILQCAYREVYQEESKRNGTKEQNI